MTNAVLREKPSLFKLFSNDVGLLTAADVYKHVGKSHTLVNQAFHDVLGTTITKAIVATRIDEAKRLLRSSLLPLAEVAKLSGFASAEYFTNSFSAAVGQSPAAYRGTKKLCTGGKVAVEFMLRTARSEWRIP